MTSSYFRTMEGPTLHFPSISHLNSHDDSVWIPFTIPTLSERSDQSTATVWGRESGEEDHSRTLEPSLTPLSCPPV